MIYDTLISADQLAALLAGSGAASTLVFDCGFDLADHSAGKRAYDAGHIPGASHMDLEHALSAAKTGRNGRHPLPTREAFVATMAALGAGDSTQVVAYDSSGGMYAARLWWMLRWIGHRQVAVLDGGLAAWKASGGTLTQATTPTPAAGSIRLRPSLVAAMSYDEVRANLESRARLVVDARAPDRFRGENETLDPIGGHIPGARNRLFRNNLAADGRFKPAAQLRDEFAAMLDGRAPGDVIHQCGSGVTACHNLLAMEHAELSGAALYPGSWSEWSAQLGAPIATGLDS